MWNLNDQCKKAKGDLLAEIARERAEENGIPYRDALIEVAKENPKYVTRAPVMPKTEPCKGGKK